MKRTPLEVLIDYYEIELEERFELHDHQDRPLPHSPFRFTDFGLVDKTDNFNLAGEGVSYLHLLISGEVTLVKIPLQLSGVEKKKVEAMLDLFETRPTHIYLSESELAFTTVSFLLPFKRTAQLYTVGEFSLEGLDFKGIPKHNTISLKELGLGD